MLVIGEIQFYNERPAVLQRIVLLKKTFWLGTPQISKKEKSSHKSGVKSLDPGIKVRYFEISNLELVCKPFRLLGPANTHITNLSLKMLYPK